MRCVTHLLFAWAWKVNFHVHFYCAGTLQVVTKLSGNRKPSKVNEAAFERGVDEVTERKIMKRLQKAEM